MLFPPSGYIPPCIQSPEKSLIWPPLSNENQPLTRTSVHLNTLRLALQSSASQSQATYYVHSFLKEIILKAGASIEPPKKLNHKLGELSNVSILRSAGPYTKTAHLIRSVESNSWTTEELELLDSFTYN